MKPEFLGDTVLKNFTKANHISNRDEILELFSKYDIYYGQKLAEKKYVVRNSILSCSMGSNFSRLNMPSDHGIIPPVAVTSDSAVNANIHPFGSCKCRADRAGSACACSPVLTTGWLQGDTVVKIWNEKTQGYENAVKDAAVLVCQYGGIIKVTQVPKKKPVKKAEILLCLHGNKIALVDTLHPKGQAIIDESIVLGNIDKDGMEIVDQFILK